MLRCYPRRVAGTNPESQLSHRIAPRLGSEEEFEAVRGILTKCGFTPEPICQRLGMAALDTYQPNRFGAANLRTAEQPVDVLILLLMDGEFVPAETVEQLLPAGAARKLEALGLIARDPERPDLWFGGCILFPTRGMWLASDRIAVPDRDAFPAFAYFGGVRGDRQIVLGKGEFDRVRFLVGHDLSSAQGMQQLLAPESDPLFGFGRNDLPIIRVIPFD